MVSLLTSVTIRSDCHSLLSQDSELLRNNKADRTTLVSSTIRNGGNSSLPPSPCNRVVNVIPCNTKINYLVLDSINRFLISG